MLRRPPIPAGPYLIVGLARSGMAAASMLSERGGQVIGVDTGAPPGAEALAARGVELHLHDDGLAQLERAGTVVKSPGVPAQAPVIAAARARGLPVLGELELAWRLLPNEFVAVTGTNGKTTTVELIGHIYREAGLSVAVAGNVGTALSGLVGELDEHATIVCETSSFQLEDTLAFAPEAAVLLNITPDHLDRHGTLEAYREAKLRIFAHQAAGDVAVLPVGLAEIELPPGVRRVRFATRHRPPAGRRRHIREADDDAGAGRRAASTTVKTRWRPRRCVSPAGSIPMRCARACARSRACPTACRRWLVAMGCCTSTTRRRPTSQARASRCRRSPRAAST